MFAQGELYELRELAHLSWDELKKLHELHKFFRLELHKGSSSAYVFKD